MALPDAEDRAVAHQITFEAILRGDHTAGDLLDRIERANPAERRQMLDRARVAAGLDTTADVEGHDKFLRANEALARRPRPPLPTCAVCGCQPVTPQGFPEEVPRVRRWHCRDHEHLAHPGDMEPPPLPIDPATMAVHDPDEDERERRKDALREEAERSRRAEREVEAEERRQRWESRAETAAREIRETHVRP